VFSSKWCERRPGIPTAAPKPVPNEEGAEQR
jgi:hypothetical protein